MEKSQQTKTDIFLKSFKLRSIIIWPLFFEFQETIMIDNFQINITQFEKFGLIGKILIPPET